MRATNLGAWARALALLVGMALASSGCAKVLPAEPGLGVEPLPADGRPPPEFEAMLFGGQGGCRADADCASSVCNFGRFCVGLVTADELWRTEKIGERVRRRLALQPELLPLATSLLASVVDREEMGIAYRARTVRALGELVARDDPRAPEVVAALERIIAASPATIAEIASLALARLGNAKGIDIVMALTESPRLATACEALRVLGSAARGAPDPASRDEALVVLLSNLSPNVEFELQRASVAGIGALGDKRSIKPLVAHLTTGPEAVANDVAAALRAISGDPATADLSADALSWDAWSLQHPPPPPPAYTPRGHNSLDDIDLPTP